MYSLNVYTICKMYISEKIIIEGVTDYFYGQRAPSNG